MNKIAIYGAGAFGKIFFTSLQKNIDFFIDDFSQEKKYQDTPILKHEDVDKNTKIYISVLQHSKRIQTKLLESGFTNVMSFSESIAFMPTILEEIAKTNYLWLVQDRSKMLDKNRLTEVDTLLSDETSHKLLQQLILLRETLDIKHYIQAEGREYFPSDIPMLSTLEKVNFIDCGAYTGDTIVELIKQCSYVTSTLSFEPDEKNIQTLQTTLNDINSTNPDINCLLYPAGVYSKNSILKFSNAGIDSSAALNENSVTLVPVVSLDNIILNANPNFIKMDIEGAEKKALIGAKKTIQKYKPNLAICLYHKPEDLWELPLLIQEIEPSYDMYIRVHEDMCLSTVLYCISKES